jgi:hypothetical protein
MVNGNTPQKRDRVPKRLCEGDTKIVNQINVKKRAAGSPDAVDVRLSTQRKSNVHGSDLTFCSAPTEVQSVFVVSPYLANEYRTDRS